MDSAPSTIALTRLPSTTTRSQHSESPTAAPSESTALRPVSKNRQILVLISSFLTIVITIGLNQSYGVFQAYYISSSQTILKSADNSPALVAFVGTLASGLTWSGSIFINPMLTRISLPQLRQLCILGVLLMSLGFGLASISSTVWQLLLTQGLLYGVGSSLLYFPILSSAPEYFNERRGAASKSLPFSSSDLFLWETCRVLALTNLPQWGSSSPVPGLAVWYSHHSYGLFSQTSVHDGHCELWR